MDKKGSDLMTQAITEAERFKPDNERDPEVGAVIVLTDGSIHSTHRGELAH